MTPELTVLPYIMYIIDAAASWKHQYGIIWNGDSVF